MTQEKMPDILRPVSEEDAIRAQQMIAERIAEKRSQAARRGAITRNMQRLVAEAQLHLTLIYHTWNKPRK